MYKVAKLIFKPRVKSEEEILDKIDAILSMLYKNGQILDNWIVESRDKCYIANVITTDDDSLDSKYYNGYIIKEVENFEIDTEIICDDPMATDSCHCDEHNYYILAIYPNENSSPIICGNCGKEISLIHIPYIYKEEEHYSILNFQRINTLKSSNLLYQNGHFQTLKYLKLNRDCLNSWRIFMGFGLNHLNGYILYFKKVKTCKTRGHNNLYRNTDH